MIWDIMEADCLFFCSADGFCCIVSIAVFRPPSLRFLRWNECNGGFLMGVVVTVC